ncbi:hypothetical protein C8R44DRAFT_973091 [Mycena epipterygia]|nr:hypothetical protein C8R44DRAFT_973091 [Mycena epipterygia]
MLREILSLILGKPALVLSTTTGAFELPPELWLKVFEYLPRIVLLSVHTTSRLFRQLATPLLFREYRFRYTPHGFTEAVESSQLKRLTFWSSAENARHVRTADITFPGVSILQNDTSLRFVERLLEAIPKFINLQSLSYTFFRNSAHIELPALRVETLANLKELHLHGGCLLRPDEPASFRIAVEHFSYTDIIVNRSDTLDHSCISMLDPTVLRSLQLAELRRFSVERFLDDNTIVTQLHSLHTLSIKVVDTRFARIHTCVARFPAIRDLTVLTLNCLVGAIPVPIAPLGRHLQRYTGPSALLPSVFAGAAPVHIEPTFDTPAKLLSVLRNARPPPSVTSLAIRVQNCDFVEGAPLTEILAMFPQLRHFSLTIAANEWHDEEYIEPLKKEIIPASLVAILKAPAALEHASIDWRLSPQYSLKDLPGFDELRDILRQAVPSLQTVDLDESYPLS